MKEDIISDVNKKLCLNCGKEILSEWGNKFCSRSCSASFNNRHRDNSVYKKISNTLKEKSLNSKSYKDGTIKQTQEKIKNKQILKNVFFVEKNMLHVYILNIVLLIVL